MPDILCSGLFFCTLIFTSESYIELVSTHKLWFNPILDETRKVHCNVHFGHSPLTTYKALRLDFLFRDGLSNKSLKCFIQGAVGKINS